MKKILVLSVLLIGISQINFVKAGDDVYDAPAEKKVKAKQTYTETQTYVAPDNQAASEKTVAYVEEGSSTSRVSSPAYNNNPNNYQTDSRYSDDDYSGSSFGYSDRISRFHNPSFQFNYGWNNWNNNYYDPWSSYNNNYGWNNWNSYSFTPSWTYGYNNFYNPFGGNTQIIIIQPGYGYNSWYNTGFYNPYNSWNNYGFSPYCSNAIYNNGYSNYSGYYDNNRKNVVYTPRTGTYGNSNNSYGNRNYNNTKNYPSNTNTNSGSWNATNNTNSSNNVSNNNNVNNNTAPAKTNKWSNNNNTNTNSNSGSWSNPYKNNNNTNTTPPSNNNNSNNNNNNSWQNNNSNSNSNSNNNSGIKIGSRPK